MLSTGSPCAHIDQVSEAVPSSVACDECLEIAGWWLHLRMCRTCGHVGCCDSSPNRHASAHFRATGHPIVCSYEPGEDWWYCYLDHATFLLDAAASFSHP